MSADQTPEGARGLTGFSKTAPWPRAVGDGVIATDLRGRNLEGRFSIAEMGKIIRRSSSRRGRGSSLIRSRSAHGPEQR